MPLRIIQLILGRFGWDRETLPTVKLLPPRSISLPRTEDGLCNLKVATLIVAGESDEVSFEAVSGQRLTIELDANGLAEIHLFAGNEEGENILGSWVADLHQPCRAICDISVTGYFTIVVENQEERNLHTQIRVACEANCNATPRKGPMSERQLGISAAAGADGLGYRDAQDHDGNGKKSGLVIPGDPPEQSSVFVARDEADGQSEHSDPSGKKADGDIEPPA